MYLRNPIDPPDLSGSDSLYSLALDLAFPVKTLKGDSRPPGIQYRSGPSPSAANTDKRMSVPPEAFRYSVRYSVKYFIGYSVKYFIGYSVKYSIGYSVSAP